MEQTCMYMCRYHITCKLHTVHPPWHMCVCKKIIYLSAECLIIARKQDGVTTLIYICVWNMTTSRLLLHDVTIFGG